jgi:hypothetical protein
VHVMGQLHVMGLAQWCVHTHRDTWSKVDGSVHTHVHSVLCRQALVVTSQVQLLVGNRRTHLAKAHRQAILGEGGQLTGILQQRVPINQTDDHQRQ